jgi:hypothetical protein
VLRTPIHPADSTELVPPLSKGQEEDVERALQDLLHSPPLRTTAQCQHLLRYIIQHTLSGETALLRERVIGSEVFGRPADYEPGEDPVVRIRAADLRKRLALYYQSLPQRPGLRIDVPSGSYRAVFIWQQDDPSTTPSGLLDPLEAVAHEPDAAFEEPSGNDITVDPALVSQEAARPSTGWSWSTTGWIVVILLIAGIIGLGSWSYIRANDPVRQFWAPMLLDPKPVLLSIGSNAVYRVGDQFIDSYIAQNQKGAQIQEGMEIYPPFQPEQSLASTGLYPAPDSFVAIGDLAAASDVIQTLTRYGKDFEERFPNDISFGEVREHSTVLIGGSNNPTGRELTKNLPFTRLGRNRIIDRDHPEKGWNLHANPDLHDTEDFAIITRLSGKDDAAPLLSVAGLGSHGTLAATEFLCKPESVRKLRNQLGSDWLKRNFQVVLGIKITDFKPVSVDIVDQRVW